MKLNTYVAAFGFTCAIIAIVTYVIIKFSRTPKAKYDTISAEKFGNELPNAIMIDTALKQNEAYIVELEFDSDDALCYAYTVDKNNIYKYVTNSCDVTIINNKAYIMFARCANVFKRLIRRQHTPCIIGQNEYPVIDTPNIAPINVLSTKVSISNIDYFPLPTLKLYRRVILNEPVDKQQMTDQINNIMSEYNKEYTASYAMNLYDHSSDTLMSESRHMNIECHHDKLSRLISEPINMTNGDEIFILFPKHSCKYSNIRIIDDNMKIIDKSDHSGDQFDQNISFLKYNSSSQQKIRVVEDFYCFSSPTPNSIMACIILKTKAKNNK